MRSPLHWMAGANKPDALGFTALDPRRWEAVKTAMKAPARRSAAAKALATPLYRHRVVRDKTRYTRKIKHRKEQ